MGMFWCGARVQPLPFMLLQCLAEAYPRGGPSGFAAANALHRAWSWSNLQPSFLQVPLYATPWHGGALASIFFFLAGGPPPALLVLPPGVRGVICVREESISLSYSSLGLKALGWYSITSETARSK